MAQGRKYETERYYDEDRTSHGNGPAWVMAAVMICAGLVFGAWLLVDMYPKGITLAAPSGAIGVQAPPEAVRRTQRYEQERQPDSAVQTSIDQYNQDEQAKFDAAVNAAPVLAPPPLNSAGEPVIDQSQQQQFAQSLQLAEQEGAAAVDQQLAAQRDAANAEALARPPDVSKEEAEKMMGRDLCSVPRANPVTCKQGLYKPTPVR